ncbi:hypothetical protein BJ508DRAFT_348560 [Ascobolus immersus RN42]|uniref:F-box domain-containing protein n=1 Tax=Ascobolus immersus RN42 TaxID=1160509 RepID=A0A3N4HYZ1_ASCIM|nr:hypothetical protein BJ508DRAFT_348560 [Ascobolus immersus RN42]
MSTISTSLGKNTMSTLPAELWFSTFSHLPDIDLISSSGVSKLWNIRIRTFCTSKKQLELRHLTTHDGLLDEWRLFCEEAYLSRPFDLSKDRIETTGEWASLGCDGSGTIFRKSQDEFHNTIVIELLGNLTTLKFTRQSKWAKGDETTIDLLHLFTTQFYSLRFCKECSPCGDRIWFSFDKKNTLAQRDMTVVLRAKRARRYATVVSKAKRTTTTAVVDNIEICQLCSIGRSDPASAGRTSGHQLFALDLVTREIRLFKPQCDPSELEPNYQTWNWSRRHTRMPFDNGQYLMQTTPSWDEEPRITIFDTSLEKGQQTKLQADIFIPDGFNAWLDEYGKGGDSLEVEFVRQTHLLSQQSSTFTSTMQKQQMELVRCYFSIRGYYGAGKEEWYKGRHDDKEDLYPSIVFILDIVLTTSTMETPGPTTAEFTLLSTSMETYWWNYQQYNIPTATRGEYDSFGRGSLFPSRRVLLYDYRLREIDGYEDQYEDYRKPRYKYCRKILQFGITERSWDEESSISLDDDNAWDEESSVSLDEYNFWDEESNISLDDDKVWFTDWQPRDLEVDRYWGAEMDHDSMQAFYVQMGWGESCRIW